MQSTRWTTAAVYAVGGVAGGTLLPRLEHELLPHVLSPLTIGAATAIYSSVASGMIALSGLVFSVTFVMVQFGATTYSPRLGLWLARDPILAHSFGTFTATFLYAIGILAWIGRGDTTGVPLISAVMVFVLLLASVAMFVALTNRVAMLQISRTLAFVGDQGRAVIDAVYLTLASAVVDPAATDVEDGDVTQVVVHQGPPQVVESVDADGLVRLAASAGAAIEVLVVVGDTVVESMPLLRVIGGRDTIDEAALRSAIELDSERTFEHDPKYAIRLLVDIAIRALSPAINDPTTAVQALDQIGDLLLRLSRRRIERGAFRDRAGRVRVIMPAPTWDDFLWLAFGEIYAYGGTSLQVMRRMHALVADLLAAIPDERRAALEYWQVRLKSSIPAHFADPAERVVATAEDRQGLGLTRRSAHQPPRARLLTGA